ncbi:MAG TPA: ribonuclease H-like YkuK family protein, partial [Puia sp.]|nr:ribonuclease H-like YkuK family protein [Puia sp.]
MERLQHWRRPDGTRIEGPIEEEVRKVLVREKTQGNRLKVCIGTDSQVKGSTTEFATVIVFLRLGKGGFMYVLPEMTQRKMSIKERMLTEVGKSIGIAYELSRLF